MPASPIRRALRAAAAMSLLLPAAAHAQPAAARGTAGDDSVAARLRAAVAPIETPRARVWVEPGALSDAQARDFAAQLTVGVHAIERTLGRTLDRDRYGTDRIDVFVAAGVGASHVYGGYAHMRHAKPWLYLDAARLRAGAAPYLHETTHLVAWRFGSHSLREGLASWVESTVSARGEGEHSQLFGVRDVASADRLALAAVATVDGEAALRAVGRPGAADASITAGPPDARAAYYVLSQSFARHLVERVGLATTLALMESEVDAYERLTSRPLDAWRADWLAAIGAGASARGATR